MEPIPPSLIEEWALAYLGHYASSAENLRRVLLRRARRRLGGDSAASEGALREVIDALVGRYRAAGLLDDAAYAAAQARRGLARGRSALRIRASLAGKGVAADDTASALLALRVTAGDPELAAACAFARRRGFGPFRRDMHPAQPEDRMRALAAFARAGFARATAERVLACADGAAVAALLGETATE